MKKSIEEKIVEKLANQFQDDEIEQIMKLIKKLSFKEFTQLKGKNHSISIPFSEEDLQELECGEEFNWTFDNVDIHLYKGEGEEEEEEE